MGKARTPVYKGDEDEKLPTGATAQPSATESSMTCADAGRIGGTKTKEKMLAKDPDYFRKIGKRGGQKVLETHGLDHFTEIGTKGGKSLKTQRGPGFYKEIGSKGGIKRRGGKS